MKHIKTALVVGAGVTAMSLGSLGVVSAATDSSSSDPESSLVSKIASKFNLNKSEVQAVFDQEHADRRAEMKTERASALKQAVTDGKLTQAQADHITAVWAEIDALMGSKKPSEQSDATRKAIKAKMDGLRTWAKQQNLDLGSIVGLHGRGGPGHGHGEMGGDRDGGPGSNSN